MEIKDRIHTLEGRYDLLAAHQLPPRHQYAGKGWKQEGPRLTPHMAPACVLVVVCVCAQV